MKSTSKLTKSISTAAALALCAAAAQAANLQNGSAAGEGELFIGIHATGGTGVGKSVVIDAGLASTLSLLGPGASLSLGSLGTDLVSTFGAGWYDRTDLLWAAVAAVQNTQTVPAVDPTNTLYGSVSGSNTWPLSTVAYTRAANGAQSTVAGRIITMASGISGSFTTAPQGATANIAVEGASDANSWASWMPGGSNATGVGNAPFGGFGTPSGQAFEQAFAAGTLSGGVEGALDFYRMFKTGQADGDLGGATTGAGSYQFTLTINQSGDITATNLTPVPEPASMSLLLAGGLFFLGVRRRAAGGRLSAQSAS